MIFNKIIKRFNKLILILSVVLLNGCLADTLNQMYGNVEVYQSKADGSKVVSMTPAFIETDGPLLYLALSRSSKMPKGRIHLNVSAAGEHNIAHGKSLHFNIDGQDIALESFDSETSVRSASTALGDTYQLSGKRYLVDEDFISWLLSSSDASVELDLTVKRVRGAFSEDGPGRAKPAFKEFMTMSNRYR